MEKNVIKSYMEYYLAIKRNKLLINLKGVMLSERSQPQKVTFLK